MNIEIDNKTSVIQRVPSSLLDELVDNLSVKDSSQSYAIKRHFKKVHPWKCNNKECGYTESRDLKDRSPIKICPVCGGTMEGYKHWCDVCNADSISQKVTPVQVIDDNVIVPTGILPRVIKFLGERNIKYSATSNISTPVPMDFDTTKDLRDYQVDILDAAISNIRGMWESPTASGKTIVALSVWAFWGAKGVIIVPNESIQRQFYEETEELFSADVFDNVGLIGGCARKILKDPWSPGNLLTIATYQTLSSPNREEQSNEYLNDIDFLLIDEHHHSAANNVFDVAQRCNATLRYGQSATLFHQELGTLFLESCTGPVIARISDSELTSAGWKAKPIVRMTALDGMFRDEFEDARMENIYNSVGVLDLVYQVSSNHNDLVLALTDRKSHMRAIYTYARNKGIDIEMVSSDTPKDEREDILNRMRNGGVNCVVATQVFDEGIDVPDATAIILASGGISPIKHKQRIGRVLRQKSGKNIAYIYDMYVKDNSHMQRHCRIRLSRYKKWGWDIEDSDIELNESGDYELIFTKNEMEFIETGKW